MSEHSDDRIPVRYRHDAADPGRPLVVVTPAYSIGFGGLVIIAAVLALFWNVFAVLAAIGGFICIVSCAPDMLRAGVLTKGDEWRKKRARAVRSRRARRAATAERLLVAASVVPGLILLAAGAALAVALVRVVLGKSASSWALWGGEATVASIALALTLEVLAQIAAQMKGDEAQGPMHFYKAAFFAEWLETNPGPRRNIQITSGVLLTLFLFAAIATD